MKKTVFILLTIVFAVFSWTTPSANKHETEKEISSTYSQYIDKYASRCASMAKMRKSKLLNIRREGAMKCLKATFLETHKEELIEKMILARVDVKEYKMQLYLNKKFFEILNMAVASTHRARAEKKGLFNPL